MSDSKNYDFKLLYDEATDEDLFEDKTHKNVANTLEKIIKQENKGLTIGLEGGWGSGKSSIVNMLRNSVKSNDEIKYFYFDAWAHEGDPLRRIFLESLIESLNKEVKNTELKELADRISHRYKSSKIKQFKGISLFGKLMSVCTLFVPIGVAVLSAINYDYLTKKRMCPPHLEFIFGTVFSALPIILVLIWGIIWLFKRCDEKFDSVKWWSIFSTESDTEITQETSEEEERSSIEFERYFNEIVSTVFNGKSRYKKLIIVIDNLDRVDPDVALKIWSTLQTFLQQKNPTTSYNKNYSIYTIVPYDDNGLKKLWDKNGDNEVSKSFFDKCFQIRISVPRPILSGWKKFAQTKIEECCGVWEEDDRQSLLSVLELTRQYTYDYPSLREMITYINQSALIRSYCDPAINTKSIAYYVYLLFMRNEKIDIPKMLISKDDEPLKSHQSQLPSGIVSDLSGLFYGVSPEKGQELLLNKSIGECLSSDNENELKVLVEKHYDAFWPVFNNIVVHDEIKNVTQATYIINKVLREDYRDELIIFLDYISEKVSSENSKIKNEIKTQGDKELAAYVFLDYFKKMDKKIWEILLKRVCLSASKGDSGLNFKATLQSIGKLVGNFSNFEPTPCIVDTLDFNLWKDVCDVNLENQYNLFNILQPTQDTVNKSSDEIQEGQKFPDDMLKIVNYFINSAKYSWANLAEKLKKYLSSHPELITDSITRILIKIYRADASTNVIINETVDTWQFFQRLFHPKEEVTRYLLVTLVHPNDLNSFVITNNPNNANVQSQANQNLSKFRNFWKSDNQKLDEIMKTIEELPLYKIIWDLCEDKSNILAHKIIKTAAEQGNIHYFKFNNKLKRFADLHTVYDNDNTVKNIMLGMFMKADIENEIHDLKLENVITYSDIIEMILQKTERNDIFKDIAGKIENLTEDNWLNSFNGQNKLLNIAVILNGKGVKPGLKNEYANGFLKFLKEVIDSDEKLVSNVLSENINQFENLTDSAFVNYVKKEFTKFLIERKFNCNISNFFVTEEFIDYQLLYGEYSNKVTELVKDSILSENKLMAVSEKILSNADTYGFSIDEETKTLISKPLADGLHKKDIQPEELKRLNYIIKKLDIKFEKDTDKDEGAKL